jgi:hypothetical protein
MIIQLILISSQQNRVISDSNKNVVNFQEAAMSSNATVVLAITSAHLQRLEQ